MAVDYEETSSQKSTRASAVHTNQNNWTYMCWTNIEDTSRGSAGQVAIGNGGNTAEHTLAQLVNVAQAPDKWGFINDGLAWVSGNDALTSGSWQHITQTQDGTTQRMYLDGVLQTNTATSTCQTPGSGFTIGGGLQTAGYSDGIIALVKCYTAALSAAQILTEMNSFYPVFTANLVAFYPLDENTGITDVDPTQSTTTNLTHINTPAWVDGPPVSKGD